MQGELDDKMLCVMAIPWKSSCQGGVSGSLGILILQGVWFEWFFVGWQVTSDGRRLCNLLLRIITRWLCRNGDHFLQRVFK